MVVDSVQPGAAAGNSSPLVTVPWALVNKNQKKFLPHLKTPLLVGPDHLKAAECNRLLKEMEATEKEDGVGLAFSFVLPSDSRKTSGKNAGASRPKGKGKASYVEVGSDEEPEYVGSEGNGTSSSDDEAGETAKDTSNSKKRTRSDNGDEDVDDSRSRSTRRRTNVREVTESGAHWEP